MRILATSNLNVRMSEYHTLMGFAPASPFASTSDHNSCDSRSLMEELTISCHVRIRKTVYQLEKCKRSLFGLDKKICSLFCLASVTSVTFWRLNLTGSSELNQGGTHLRNATFETEFLCILTHGFL